MCMLSIELRWNVGSCEEFKRLGLLHVTTLTFPYSKFNDLKPIREKQIAPKELLADKCVGCGNFFD